MNRSESRLAVLGQCFENDILLPWKCLQFGLDSRVEHTFFAVRGAQNGYYALSDSLVLG